MDVTYVNEPAPSRWVPIHPRMCICRADDTHSGGAFKVAQEPDPAAPQGPTHPRCSECDVPMWLAKIEKTKAGEYRHFECKVCDAKVVWQAPPS